VSTQDFLTVSREVTDRAVIITVTSEVDMLSVDRLQSEIVEGPREPVGPPVIVDLTRVTFLGSNGLNVLVEADREAQHHDEPLRIVVGHQHPVMPPLQVSGLDRMLELYVAVQDAIAAETRLPPTSTT